MQTVINSVRVENRHSNFTGTHFPAQSCMHSSKHLNQPTLNLHESHTIYASVTVAFLALTQIMRFNNPHPFPWKGKISLATRKTQGRDENAIRACNASVSLLFQRGTDLVLRSNKEAIMNLFELIASLHDTQ